MLQESAGIAPNTTAEADTPADGSDKEKSSYTTFLAHLFDLVEEKITMDRYDEGVRQLVGNQVGAREFVGITERWREKVYSSDLLERATLRREREPPYAQISLNFERWLP